MRRAAWVGGLLLVLLAPSGARGEEGAIQPSPASPPARILRLTLDEALRLALQGNLEVRAGAYDPLLARAAWDVEVAAFDTLLTVGTELSHTETPSVSAFFGRNVVSEEGWRTYAGLERRLVTGGTVSFLYRADRLSTDSAFVTLNPSWTQSATVEARQPLLRGAGDRALAEVRRARIGMETAGHAQRALVEQVLLDVATAYWELVYADAEVLARRKAEDVATELLRDAEARLDARVGTPLDVAEARAGVQQRRGDRIGAEGARGAAEDRLRMLVLPFAAGGEHRIDILPVDDAQTARDATPGEGELERHLALALRTRPDALASCAELESRSLDVRIAYDALKPQLDLVGRVSDASLARGFGDATGDLFGGEAISASIGVELSLYIGRRGAKAGLRLAEWARRQAVLRHKNLENRILSEVRAGLRDVRVARARLEAAQVEVEAADEGLEGERERLAQGKSTPYRVLEKEESATGARTRAARAASDLRTAQARFWHAVGLLGPTYGVTAASR